VLIQLSHYYDCGFGGCRAPTRPLPVSAPSADGQDPNRRPQEEAPMGVVLHLGFGGCRAPVKPEPVALPGADRKVERLAA
jgi:hypothetical protein